MLDKIFDTITSFTTLQAFIAGGIFIFGKKKNKASVILGLFLIAYVGTNLQWMLLDYIRILPLTFSYLICPLFFIYAKNITGEYKNKDLLHLLPALLEFFFYIVLSLAPHLAYEFYQGGYKTFTMIVFILVPPVYNMAYAFMTIKAISKAKIIIPEFFTELEVRRLNWIIAASTMLGFFYGLEIVTSLIKLNTNFDSAINILETFGSCFVVYWVSFHGFSQKVLMEQYNNSYEPKSIKPIPAVPDSAPATDFSDLNREKYDRIVAFFNETKIYKNKEISLFMVSSLLQLSHKEVSRLINSHSQKNFNQFVNEFRIEESKRLLADPGFGNLNLSGIADESGFNSRSAFFTAFKNAEGVAPSEYKNGLKTVQKL